MDTEVFEIKRMLKSGVVLGSFTLAACGGYGQQSPALSASGTKHFTTLSLQAVSSTISRTSSDSRQATDSSRQIQDACANNFTTSATGDPHYHAQGTLSNGQSFNTPTWLDTSLGYTNWLTSPIDGGYNFALTQNAVSNVYIATAIVITTHGNNIRVQLSANNGALQPPNVSIIDSGKSLTIPPLSSAFQLTLSAGEQISWTLNPSPINSYGVAGSTNLAALTETVRDGNASITTTANYWYGSVNGLGATGLDILVNASNVDLGGYMISTALGNGTVPCPTPTPVPTPVSSPPCALPTPSSPNPHPTEKPTIGACTTS